VGREGESLYEAGRLITSTGGLTEQGTERSGITRIFYGGRWKDAVVLFYTSLLVYEAGEARIGNFFLAGSLELS
jgi:hypothetical protein